MSETRYSESLVRALVSSQHPDLAGLPLTEVNGGWDNHQWRLGDELAVRLPRTERGPQLLINEQRWLPHLATSLPLPVPVPVRYGAPSSAFPHPWSIVQWVLGEPADEAAVHDAGAAVVLAGFLRALHQPAPANAPTNPYRGGPLDGVDAFVERWSEIVEDDALVAKALEVWQDAVRAPRWSGASVWLHADLHPANVVTRDGQLAGVIDFGDLCAGDPATDLMAAWILLPEGAADTFFEHYRTADAATVARARGWGVLRAVDMIMVGKNGRLGLPGGKPTWEHAGYLALDRLVRWR